MSNTPVSLVSSASSPSVAYQADGSWLLVWSSSDGSGNGVWGQRYAADGSTLGAIYQINTNPADSQDDAQVLLLANGSFLVTWREGAYIYGQRLTSDGVPTGDEFFVASGVDDSFIEPSGLSGHAVAALADGGFVVITRANPGLLISTQN